MELTTEEIYLITSAPNEITYYSTKNPLVSFDGAVPTHHTSLSYRPCIDQTLNHRGTERLFNRLINNGIDFLDDFRDII